MTANTSNRPIRSSTASRLIFAAATFVHVTCLACCVFGQSPGPAIKQVPAPLPKLILSGTVNERNGSNQYHRITLTISNWERYSPEMFVLPVGARLQPGACAASSSRVVIAIYSDRGELLSNCIAVPRPSGLGGFSLRIQKGRSVPPYVYAVINDRYTGAVYRSNLVSPLNGTTK